MTQTIRIVVMDTCAECGGFLGESTCRECKDEGVTEKQITIRELRHLLLDDMMVEKAEMEAGRFEEVSSAK